MEGRTVLGGLGRYFGWLVAVAVFPIAWAKAMGVAKRHQDTDPRSTAKVGIGIALGVLLLAGGIYYGVDFHGDNIHGMYESLDNRLAIALGNNAYNEAVDAGDQERAAELAGNRDLYERVSVAVLAHDDARAKQLIEDRGDVDYPNLDERAATAFDIKDDAVRQFNLQMNLLVFPGFVGLLYAPLVFTLGNVLKHAYEQSETVGFKVYPGASAGWFLLLGAFGIPALPFAAWVMKDISERSVEGQIAL